jgi:hypothetical protein
MHWMRPQNLCALRLGAEWEICYNKTKKGANRMSQELLNNKELQNLIASLGTDDEPDQPLGKYGRMAMKHLHETNSQRFSLLKMTGELLKMMYRVDEEASERVEAIVQKMLRKNPMPQTDDILVKTRHFNTQKCIAEELVIHEMVLVAR